MKPSKFQVGDRVRGWGITSDPDYLNSGPVTRVYWCEVNKDWRVDWHNERVFHWAVHEGNLLHESTPVVVGLERCIPV